MFPNLAHLTPEVAAAKIQDLLDVCKKIFKFESCFVYLEGNRLKIKIVTARNIKIEGCYVISNLLVTEESFSYEPLGAPLAKIYSEEVSKHIKNLFCGVEN